jgi:hypothetical protein
MKLCFASVWLDNPEDPSWDNSGRREKKCFIKAILHFLWVISTETAVQFASSI